MKRIKRLFKKIKGFTLIELLIVMAIIAILAGVVLVATSGLRKSAEVAQAKAFERNLINAAVAAGGETWQFDEGSGSVVNNLIGFGSPGTKNSTATFVTTTPSEIPYAIRLNGNSSAVTMPSSNFPTVTNGGASSGFSMGVWFKWEGSAATPWASIYTRYDPVYVKVTGIVLISDELNVVVESDWRHMRAPGVSVTDGEWHYIVLSVDDTNKTMSTWVDGKEVDVGPYEGTLWAYDANDPFVVGSIGGGTSAADGIIDNPFVMAKPLD